ncbi:MAG TPA: YidB family protein [Casimicrobiaceae bacterium]|nr:YidB family protein [Casimicrobiaceae bacterium]
MGMLDGLLGSMMGGMMGGSQSAQGAGGASPMIQMALQMLQQNGGIEGLLAKFQQAGMGQQAQSWIGTGQNMPISADALSQIFGQGQMGQIAQQLGMSHEDAAGGLAQALPHVIDQMTPGGEIPAEHNDLVAQALAILQKGRQA